MGRPANTPENFWNKVRKTTDCWVWTAAKNEKGYGLFSLKGKMVRAHIYAYQEEYGLIKEGLVLDHLCRNRPCVKPSHLEPVTHKENILRGEGITAQNARAEHCPQGHYYSTVNTYIRPDGGRGCRECIREHSKNYKIRKMVVLT